MSSRSPEGPERGSISSTTSSAGIPARRTHTKSRTGCSTCKQRRVKCDEQVPVCKNCQKGGRTCVYANTTSPKNVPQIEHTQLIQVDFFNLSLRQQEFWLMHHYYTTTGVETFTNDPFVPEEFMIYVGQQAVVHDFVQDMVFAAVLLHLAYLHPVDQSRYRELAIQYQSRSIARFQVLLESPGDDAEALWICGCLIGTNTWANSRLDRLLHLSKATADVMGVSRLWYGALVLPFLSSPHVERWPFSALANRPVTNLDGELHLQRDVSDALEKVDGLILSYAASCQPSNQNASLQDHEHAVEVYQLAMKGLLTAYESFADKGKTVESLLWPTEVGGTFIQLLDAGEPLASLIAICYGVLLHFSVDDKWWAEGLGKALVDEIAPTIVVHGQTWAEIADWARHRVGLEKSALTHLSLASKT